MELRFDPVVPRDAALLAQFLSQSEWPYHFERRIDGNWVRGRLQSGHFFGADSRSFLCEGAERL
jgi:hypothetical protein